MVIKDICEYYTGDMAIAEEEAWKIEKPYVENAAVVSKLIYDKGIEKVVEIGCGSGFIPTELPESVEYLGVDYNDNFLKWAMTKNISKTRRFIKEDVRNLSPDWLKANSYPEPGLVCSFAFLKHFGLHEWDDILKTILSLAKYACFAVQVSHRDLDNGTDYHHVFVTQDHLNKVINDGGHKFIYDVMTFDGECPEIKFQTKIIITKRA